jgi:hypothetical protein
MIEPLRKNGQVEGAGGIDGMPAATAGRLIVTDGAAMAVSAAQQIGRSILLSCRDGLRRGLVRDEPRQSCQQGGVHPGDVEILQRELPGGTAERAQRGCIA